MSVIIRRVKTALQAEYRKAGGVRVDEAIAQASENLDSLSEACLERIDAALAVVVEMTSDPHRRPSPDELRKLHALINDMLACCASVRIEGLAETLYAVARLVGALLVTEAWIDGTLTPAVNLLRLARRGAISAGDIHAVIAGIDQCAQHLRPPATGRVPQGPESDVVRARP